MVVKVHFKDGSLEGNEVKKDSTANFNVQFWQRS